MIVDCAVYENGKRRGGELALDEAYEAGRHPDAFVWIGLYEPDEAEFESVRREFSLHHLAVEDAIKAHQRPKLEIYGDSLFVVLKTASYDDQAERIVLGEIMLFIGEGFVVTVRHRPASALGDLRRRIEGEPELLRLGPGAVLHAIIDRVVDGYLPVVEALDEHVNETEHQVFSPGRANPAERIYRLLRQVLTFEHATMPLVAPLEQIVSQSLPEGLVHGATANYFRDVQDHLLRVVGRVRGFRDLLTSILQANLTQVSLRQNEDMRKISAWVAIAAVPTMIAGVYGMNFDNMPELRWWWGYFAILGVMATVCGLLYYRFKRSGWL